MHLCACRLQAKEQRAGASAAWRPECRAASESASGAALSDAVLRFFPQKGGVGDNDALGEHLDRRQR
jgi:hypothetical protein